MNNIHDYSELRKQIKAEISAAVFKSAKEGITSGLTNAIEEQFKVEAGEIEIDSSKLAEKVSDSIQKAITQGIQKEKIQGVDVSDLISLNPEDLVSKIREMYDEGADETAKGAKRMIAAMKLAEDQGIGKDQIADALDKKIAEFNLYFEDLKETTRMSQKAFDEFGQNVISIFTDVNHKIDQVVEDSITDFDKLNSSLNRNVKKEIKAFKDALNSLSDADYDKAASDPKKFDELEAKVTSGLMSAQRAVSILVKQGEEVPGLKDLFDKVLERFIATGGKQDKMKAFWEEISEEIKKGDSALKGLIEDLGLLQADGSALPIKSGANNLGGLIGADNIVIARKIVKGISGDDVNYNSLKNLQNLLDDAANSGANVSRILEVVDDSAKGLIMTLEEALPGKDVENLIDGVSFNPEFLQASDKAVQKLVSDLKILYDLGAGLDVESGNIKYDSLTDQFYIFDIDTKSIHQNFEEVMGDLKTFFDYQEDLLRDGGDTSNADLVKGFKDRLSAVYDASKEVVVTAKKGIQDAQDSHSDAKEFKPLGKDATGGYAAGMVENKERVEEAAEEVVEAAVDATRKATEEAQGEIDLPVTPEFEDYDPTAVDEMVKQIEEKTGDAAEYVSALSDEVNNFFNEFGKLIGSDYATVRDNPRFDEILGRVDSGEITGKKAVDILLGKDQLEGDRYYTQEIKENAENLHDAAEEFVEAKDKLTEAVKESDEELAVGGAFPWDDDFDNSTTALDTLAEKAQKAREEIDETSTAVENLSDKTKEMSSSEFSKFESPGQFSDKISQKMLSAVRNHSKVAREELSKAIEQILLEENQNAYRTAAILLASSKEKKEAWEMEGGLRYDSVKDYIKKSGAVYINEQIQGDIGDYRKRMNSLMRGKYTYSDTSKLGVDVYLREMNTVLNTSFKTLRELLEYLDNPPTKEEALGKLYDQGAFEDTMEKLRGAVDKYKKDYLRTNEEQRNILKRRDENLRRLDSNKKTLYQEEQEKRLKEEAEEIDEAAGEALDKQAQQEAWLNSVYETRLRLKEESLQAQQKYNDLLAKEETLHDKQAFYDSQVGKTLEEEQRLGAIQKYNDVLDDARTRYTTIEAIVGRINKQNEKAFPTNLEDQIRKAASMMALIERYKELAGDDYDVNQIGGQKAVDFYSDYYGMTQNKAAGVREQLSEINQELYKINKQKEEIVNNRPLFAIEKEISAIVDRVKEVGKFGPRQKQKFEKLLEEYESKGGSPFVSKAYSNGTLFSSDLSELTGKEYTLEDVVESYQRMTDNANKAKTATKSLVEEQKKVKEAAAETPLPQGEQQATIDNVVESLKEQEQAQAKVTAEVEKTNEAIKKEDEWTQEEIDQEVKELFSPKVEAVEKASIEETVEAVKEEKEAREEVTQEIKKSAEAQKELNEETKKSSSKSENVPKGPKPPTPESIERQYKEAADKYEKIRQRVPEGLLGTVFNEEDFPNIKGNFNTILQMLDEVSEKASGIASYDLTKESDVERVKKLTKEINVASTDINKFIKNKDLANEGSMTNTFSNIESFLRRNTKLSQEARLTLRGLSKEIQNSFDPNKNNISMTNKRLGEIRTKFATIQVEARKTGQAGGSLLAQTSKQLGFLNERWLGQILSIRDIIRYLRTMFEEVKGIDSALIELKKVSKDLSFERLDQSLKNSFETARELGVEVKEVVQATADWARLGYGIEDAEALAKVTSLFRNVGDELTLDTASEYLISTLKGFEMVPEQAMNIVDQFNEVANNFAINTAGIGQALERSAASFNAANTDLSESIALVTAANAVAQNPESVGKVYAHSHSNM